MGIKIYTHKLDYQPHALECICPQKQLDERKHFIFCLSFHPLTPLWPQGDTLKCCCADVSFGLCRWMRWQWRLLIGGVAVLKSFLCFGFSQVITWHWILWHLTKHSDLHFSTCLNVISTSLQIVPSWVSAIFYLDFYFPQLGLAQTHTYISFCPIFGPTDSSTLAGHPRAVIHWRGLPPYMTWLRRKQAVCWGGNRADVTAIGPLR